MSDRWSAFLCSKIFKISSNEVLGVRNWAFHWVLKHVVDTWFLPNMLHCQQVFFFISFGWIHVKRGCLSVCHFDAYLTSIWHWKHHHDRKRGSALPPLYPSDGNATLQWKPRHVKKYARLVSWCNWCKWEKLKINTKNGFALLGLIVSFCYVCLTTTGTAAADHSPSLCCCLVSIFQCTRAGLTSPHQLARHHGQAQQRFRFLAMMHLLLVSFQEKLVLFTWVQTGMCGKRTLVRSTPPH